MLFLKNIWAIGGGKGGVGKSVMAANLACGLARQGSRVTLIDADLAGANIHTLFGIRYPEVTLADYLKKRVAKFSDVLIPTAQENLNLICGASDLLEMANPKYAQKQKLMRAIADLDADYIIIDIGAGSTLNNLDFFNAAHIGILVTTPMPTAVQNAYTFLKMALHRRVLSLFSDEPALRSEIASALEDGNGTKSMIELVADVKKMDEAASWKIIKTLVESRYRLIVNMSSEMDGQRIANALAGLAYQFLRLKLPCFGTVGVSADIEQSVRKLQPLMLSGNTVTSQAIRKITLKMKDETMQFAVRDQVEKKKDERQPKPGIEVAGEKQTAIDKSAADRIGPGAMEGRITKEPDVATRYKASETESTVQLCMNDEFVHEGIRLHIQTEDLGIKKAKVLTLVFRGGRILFSKETDYGQFADQQHLERSVAERVRWQHKAILAGIHAGKLGDRLSAEGGA
ncbi:MAG: P-loop NTPase [Nitrospirae bacterium]|nr:P-loop NTPase [Nitrospirota bacterium]